MSYDQMFMVSIRLNCGRLNILLINQPRYDLDLLTCYMKLYDNLNIKWMFLNIRLDDNLHNLLFDVNQLMENLMLRD